ncbi:OLC1v1018801C1 [Oldenlandia corymbosa var. corymbosa]|uniref:OLC1v1018801C1 n=1 Tax=Oldenlandia corymbosa var. corymbosa TaxID=529605 RepID=A0AAV1ECI8_OLDCO|nr:OLC1v1018801C1 [Oldenlandia corymbosa var. corymbosa]
MANFSKVKRRSLSELPEEIIHHILSFLTNKEATQASTLSKGWYGAFGSRPDLVFNYQELRSDVQVDRVLFTLKRNSINLRLQELEKNENFKWVTKGNMVDRDDLREAEFDVPNVVLFEYEGDITPRFSFTASSRGWTSRLKIKHIQKVDTSWFLKLKGFLTRFHKSDLVDVSICSGDQVEFNLDDAATKDGTCSTIDEVIAKLFVTIQIRPILNQECPEASVLAILRGIFWIGRPLMI